MDPISFLASITALAQMAFQVVGYLHDIKGGDKQRLKLSAEVSALWLVIDSVKEQLESVDPTLTMKYFQTFSKPSGPLSQCQEIFQDLQRRLNPQSGLRAGLRALSWPFEKDEALKLIDRIHRLQTGINTSLMQINVAVSQNILMTSQAVKQTLDDRELLELLNWLSPLNFAAQHNQHRQSRCYGTGQWFLESDHFRAWSETKFPVLWCPGLPGSGKTVISSAVFDHLQAQSQSSNVTVLGIYCDFKLSQAGMQTPQRLVGSLLKQFIQASNEVPDETKAVLRQGRKDDVLPSLDELMKHLSTLLSDLNRTFVVVDALDELLTADDRTTLLRSILSLSNPISVMVTARTTAGLEKWIGPLHHFCDICHSYYEQFLFHCSNHVQGGYDLCQSCSEKNVRRCPDSAHGPMVRLANTPRLIVSADSADIECYIKTRIHQDDNLQGLIAQSLNLEQRIVDAILTSSHSM